MLNLFWKCAIIKKMFPSPDLTRTNERQLPQGLQTTKRIKYGKIIYLLHLAILSQNAFSKQENS